MVEVNPMTIDATGSTNTANDQTAFMATKRAAEDLFLTKSWNAAKKERTANSAKRGLKPYPNPTAIVLTRSGFDLSDIGNEKTGVKIE